MSEDKFTIVSRRQYAGKEFVKILVKVVVAVVVAVEVQVPVPVVTRKDKCGMDGRAASEMADDCAQNWPDPRVAQLAATFSEAGAPLNSHVMQQIEKLVTAQEQTQKQIGVLQKQMLDDKQEFRASSLESKGMQKAVEASLATLRAEQSRSVASRRGDALEAEQLQRALDQSLESMRKETLAREAKWKGEDLEDLLRRIRSEDVRRLEKNTFDLRNEIARLQLVERELGRMKHEHTVVQTKLTQTQSQLQRECKESAVLRQLLGQIWFGEESQGRGGLQRIESAARLRMSNTLGLLKLEALEQHDRRELMWKFSAPPCNMENEWEAMQVAKWMSAVIDPDSGIRGYSLQPGRASDAEPPALVETPDQNRRRKSDARDPDLQQSSMTSRVTGLAIRLYETLSPAPKKSKPGENEAAESAQHSDQSASNSRDRDRDDSRVGSGTPPRQIADEKWQIGQLVLAKEERKGEFGHAEVMQIDPRLGVRVKWAESGALKWLRKDLWADRLKESCRAETASAAELR
eukprot:gene10810-biopygen7467